MGDFQRRHDFTLEQLRIFLAVAASEHMTSAAHDLNIAQSAVSATISSLEASLDIRLFERKGRNIRLSINGQILRNEASILLQYVSDLRARIANLADHGCGQSMIDRNPRRTTS